MSIKAIIWNKEIRAAITSQFFKEEKTIKVHCVLFSGQ